MEFDPAILRPLLAGWITGAAVGLASTAIVVIAVVRSRRWPRQFARLRISIVAFAIAAANGMVIGWTLIGLLAGAAWIASPARFPLLAGAVGLAFAALYAYVRGLEDRGEAAVVLGCTLVATLAFALALPLLAAA